MTARRERAWYWTISSWALLVGLLFAYAFCSAGCTVETYRVTAQPVEQTFGPKIDPGWASSYLGYTEGYWPRTIEADFDGSSWSPSWPLGEACVVDGDRFRCFAPFDVAITLTTLRCERQSDGTFTADGLEAIAWISCSKCDGWCEHLGERWFHSVAPPLRVTGERI